MYSHTIFDYISQEKITRDEQEKKPSVGISKKFDQNESSSDAQTKPNGKTNKIIIQLSQRLRSATVNIEAVTLKNKQLVKKENKNERILKIKCKKILYFVGGGK